MTPAVTRYDAGRDLQRLTGALRQLDHLPYTRPFGLEADGVIAWLASMFGEGGEDHRALLAASGGDVVAGLVLQRRPWESAIYGVPMARIPFAFVRADGADGRAAQHAATALLHEARQVLAAWGVRHCSVLVPAEYTTFLHALNQDRWLLVDSTLEMAWECGRTVEPEPDARFSLRAAHEGDRETIAQLARHAYTHSIRTRYSADPGLPRETTGELYAEWVREAVDGRFADVVVVADVDGRAIAFNTFRNEAVLSRHTGIGFAAHGISAVDPAYRGLRMQPGMLFWLSEWQRARGGRYNFGRVLINNYVMQRACLRSGAFNSQAYHTFHVWLDAGDPAER
jgi:hypothetical protein